MKTYGQQGCPNWPACSDMELEVKLQVLARWSKNRLPKNLKEQKLKTKNGLKAYRQGLERLLETDSDLSPIKTELIQSELKAEE